MADEPIVELEHVLGVRELSPISRTIGDVLANHHLPETMFQPYLVRGDALTPIPAWTLLSEVPADVDRILVRAIRNTLFPTVLPGWNDDEIDSPVGGGTGFRSISEGSDGSANERRVVVERDQAREQVNAQVGSFVDEYDIAADGCVFGVSGGGDSNALAYGLKNALPGDRLIAFTLVFREVMPKRAAVRASLLCQELGIEHRIYSDAKLCEFLGVTTSLDALYTDFRGIFGHEALHFFGTFLILKTARTLGAELGFRNLAFGYNREDLLAELIFMLMNGHAPLEYPVRTIGDQRIVMPVWKTPKLLLDACHPTFSLENYRERDHHTTRQRSLAFFLAHTLDSAYPSFGLSLLTGTRKVVEEAFGQLHHDADSDLFVTGQATPERLQLVRDLLARHFGDRAVL